MLKSNVNPDQLKSKSLFALVGILLLLIALALPNTAMAQKNNFNNEISFSTQLGRTFNDVTLQYQRPLNNYFSAVGSIGNQNWKRELKQFESGRIEMNAQTLGVGAQLHLSGKSSGFFIQANVLLRQVKRNASAIKLGAEIPNSNESGVGYNTDYPVTSFLVGLLLGGSNTEREPNIHLKYENQQTLLGINGKLGYKFISKNERISFTPSINFESIPGSESITLSNNQNKKQTLNVHNELKKARINVGWAFGFRF